MSLLSGEAKNANTGSIVSGVSRPGMAGEDGQRVGLDTQVLRGASRQHPAEALPDAALVDLDHRYGSSLLGGLGGVAEIRYQTGGVLPDPQQRGGPAETREIPDIGEMGDQQPIQPLRLERSSQRCLTL